MTPEQAIQNLDNAVSQMNLSRAQHAGLMQSIQVLNALIPKPAPQQLKEVKGEK